MLNRIKKNEGFSDSLYKDQLGNPTVGYGHLVLSRDGFVANKRYPKKTLLRIFHTDLRRSIFDFKKNYHYKPLPDNAQEVVIEMIFQLGITRVLKFKKFNFHMKQKQFYLAALEMIKSRWYQQTPKRVNKLISVLLEYDVKQ